MTYPISIPGFNKFRALTPPAPLPNDKRVLVIVANAAMTRYLVGQASILADVNAWEQSTNGITPQEAVDAINEITLVYDLCAFIAQCIQTDADVQNAIQNISSVTGDTVINDTVYSDTDLIAGNADSNGCADDDRYGRALALVDYLNLVSEDFYQTIDAATNILEEISELISAIPFIETLPFDELVSFIGTTGEQWYDSYLASYSTQLREQFACDLYCRSDSCNLKLADASEAILERYNLTTTQGLINAVSMSALIARVAQTVGAGGGATYIGDDFVYLSWLLQIVAIEAGGQFFGVTPDDYVREAANGTPATVPASCTCPQTIGIVTFDASGYQDYTIAFGSLNSTDGNPPPCGYANSNPFPPAGGSYVNVDIDLPSVGNVSFVKVNYKWDNNVVSDVWRELKFFDASGNLIGSRIRKTSNKPKNTWLTETWSVSKANVKTVRVTIGRSTGNGTPSSGQAWVDNITVKS